MSRFVVLLRAVNVGGTGKLQMADLRKLCVDAGFEDVQTYIASGNVVLSTDESASVVQSSLEQRLGDLAGKPVGVLVRTPAEMKTILERNPFVGREPRFTLIVFLPDPPPADAAEHIKGHQGEEIVLGDREIYVYYGQGMGKSRLRIPAAKSGTARNLNTVKKLVEMAYSEP